MFCVVGLVSGGFEGIGSRIMFFAPGLIFGGTEGAETRFNVLRSRTRFGRNRGNRVLFSCFALPDLFWVVLRAPAPVFMSYALELVLGGTEGFGSCFNILRS
jgi:hypothetical protein